MEVTMQITLESDYAARITDCLCKSEKRLDAKTISEETGVTLRFSLKILRKLVAAGITKSYKGTQGGYEIAKSPKEISLKDIIEAIEGYIVINRCIKGEFPCTKGTEDCKIQTAFCEISSKVKETMSQYTFDKFN